MPGKIFFLAPLLLLFYINNTNTLHSNEAVIALLDDLSIFTSSSNKKDVEAVAQYEINTHYD